MPGGLGRKAESLTGVLEAQCATRQGQGPSARLIRRLTAQRQYRRRRATLPIFTPARRPRRDTSTNPEARPGLQHAAGWHNATDPTWILAHLATDAGSSHCYCRSLPDPLGRLNLRPVTRVVSIARNRSASPGLNAQARRGSARALASSSGAVISTPAPRTSTLHPQRPAGS